MTRHIAVLVRRALVTGLLFTALLGFGGTPLANQGVAFVTDVSGQVIGQRPVIIMSEIDANADIGINEGARLVVIYLNSGEEYVFAGPSQIRFSAKGPEVISGAQPQKRAN